MGVVSSCVQIPVPCFLRRANLLVHGTLRVAPLAEHSCASQDKSRRHGTKP